MAGSCFRVMCILGGKQASQLYETPFQASNGLDSKKRLIGRKRGLLRIGQPLPVDKAAFLVVPVPAKDLVAFREALDTALVLLKLAKPPSIASA